MTTSIYISKKSLEYRTQQFFINSEKVHHGFYDLSKVVYVSAKKKVILGCPIHGDFEQLPNNHLNGGGCFKCGIDKTSDNQRHSVKEFIGKANIVHNNKYTYPNIEYIKSTVHLLIECPDHGTFSQAPNNHLKGSGCAICGSEKSSRTRTSNIEEFIEKASIIHKGLYAYPNAVYTIASGKLLIECPIHGEFSMSANHHLKGQPCPKCSPNGYSKIAIKWLDSFNLNIQHAENYGEYNIPTTRYRVDGYDKESNTVYEFHGDAFHGNPDLYEDDYLCHPYNKEVTTKELYDKTIEREDEIKSLGYNLVVMWENTYKNELKIA